LSYLALDIETANADYSSICQLGFAEFQDGEILNTWKSLINPEDYFDVFTV
jgi:DNA polymerase-3 subunit epsilon